MDAVDIEFDFSLVFEFEDDNKERVVVFEKKKQYYYCHYWH